MITNHEVEPVEDPRNGVQILCKKCLGLVFLDACKTCDGDGYIYELGKPKYCPRCDGECGTWKHEVEE